MEQLRSIHTLNARGHIFLEVSRDYFSLNSQQMHGQIRMLRDSLEATLKTKGVEYSSLKGALAPDPHRKEAAFVFDTYELQDETWYGLHVFERIMPLIDKRSSHSFLMGDFIGENSQQDALFEQFSQVITLSRDFDWRHSGLLYIVYMNNLTDEMINNIHRGLADYAPYVGFADCTYYSKFKRHLALTLSNVFLKQKATIIQGDPDSDSDGKDHNTSGYPFEKFGYKIRSVDDISFGALLSYKIEIPKYKGFEADEEFSLNYMTPNPVALDKFNISVSEAKAEYVRNAKSKSMERAGYQNISANDLSKLIQLKIADNYIYSMRTNEFGEKLFNVIIEVNFENIRTRLLCGLKFVDSEQNLFLVTLF